LSLKKGYTNFTDNEQYETLYRDTFLYLYRTALHPVSCLFEYSVKFIS